MSPFALLPKIRSRSRQPLHGHKLPASGITMRTALLAWLVAIGTLMIFVAAVIPEQNRAFIENLRSKAHGVTVSLHEIAAGAAVNDDFSSVVDHCTEMLKGDPSIDYIVITRNDGFSLVHDRSGWRVDTLDQRWHPVERVAFGGIERVSLFNRRVYAYAQPFGYSGIEWGWIHVGLSLDAYDQSVASVYRRTSLLVLAAILLGLVASILYARHLVRPILHLQSVVERVAAGDLSAHAKVERKDELGSLGESVNTMTEAILQRDRTLKEANETLEIRVADRTRELREQVEARERTNRELAEAQRRLMQLSREAGMAEVATGVLHNVGNVLNSVNISTQLLHDRLNQSQLANFRRTVELINAQGENFPRFLVDDPRGRLIPGFLTSLAKAFEQEHTLFGDELNQLAQNVGHIKEIISAQQSYAKTVGIAEQLPPADLFTEAERIVHASVLRHSVVVTRRLEPAPLIVVDRHRVLQILVNLMSNAIHAVKPNPPGNRAITLHLKLARPGMLSLVVQDNGIGIAPENLKQIFVHGFTTRKDGHGFGLHSGAIAAQLLGGTLQVSSEGTGHGATFTLELPVAPSAGQKNLNS